MNILEDTALKLPSNLKVVMVICFVFGNYYDLAHSKLTSLVLKVYCIIFCILGSTFILNTVHTDALQFYSFLQFIYNLFASLMFRGKYYMKFFSEISKFDDYLNVNQSAISPAIFIAMFVLPMVRFLRVVGCYFFLGYKVDVPLQFMVLMSINLCYVPTIMIFDAMYLRMRYLRRAFDRIHFKSFFEDSYNKEMRIANLKKCLVIYSDLINNLNVNDIELQTMTFGVIVFIFPRAVLSLYNFIISYIKKTGWYTLANSGTLFSYNLVTICLPGVLMELAANEVDKIIDSLSKQQYICLDVELQEAIEHTLECISLHSVKYRIFRAIPLDGSLMLTVFSLCITYVVVVLQFIVI